MEYAPAWILDKALGKEVNQSWTDAINPGHEMTISKKSNVITSHGVYRVKSEEKGQERMKARLCPHGKCDKMKKID